jgi:phosphonate transport system substrate-binding protein
MMASTLRPLLLALLAAALLPSAQALTLGVTEGVTYRATDADITARFEPIAAHLSAALKQPVTIRVLSSYDSLREATAKREVDLAFVHPAHVALQAVKGGHYRSLAWTSGFTEYTVAFLCKDPQPIQNWSSLATKKLVTPDPDSITAVMTRAMLRENGLQPGAPQLMTTRYQDAVPFYVENGFSHYGATAARALIKDWQDKGGKVCAKSKPVPIKHWIASNALPPATLQTLRETLVAMKDADPGRKALATSGYKGFEASSTETEQTLIGWLGL